MSNSINEIHLFLKGLSLIFNVMQVILLFLVPESPKFLLLKKKDTIAAQKGEGNSV